MIFKVLLSLVTAMAVLPMPAFAQEPGFFAGLDAAGGMARGSSGTRDGGGFGGGGIVKNVTFGTTAGIGAHIGYQFDRELSGFVSYQYVRGDVDWDAVFPHLGQTLNFSGTASSNAVLINVAYAWSPSDTTTVRASAGAGVTFNTLSGVTETTQAGVFVSDLEDHTQASPMVRIGAAIEHRLSRNTLLGLNASIAYAGDFSTGNTRTGNLGRTSMHPYEIDDVWRASLGVSMQARF